MLWSMPLMNTSLTLSSSEKTMLLQMLRWSEATQRRSNVRWLWSKPFMNPSLKSFSTEKTVLLPDAASTSLQRSAIAMKQGKDRSILCFASYNIDLAIVGHEIGSFLMRFSEIHDTRLGKICKWRLLYHLCWNEIMLEQVMGLLVFVMIHLLSS